jgi:hypothetical protein
MVFFRTPTSGGAAMAAALATCTSSVTLPTSAFALAANITISNSRFGIV